MAIKSTVCKAELEVVDMDRHHYETYRLTLARHPSETDERMMVRLLAFALNSGERLEFGAGISESEEPDLWEKDYSGDVVLWIEIGHPDAKILSKAVKKARRVLVYAYSALPDRWWGPIAKDFEGAGNLEVYSIAASSAAGLAALASKAMALQCSVQDGDVVVRGDGGAEAAVAISRLK